VNSSAYYKEEVRSMQMQKRTQNGGCGNELAKYRNPGADELAAYFLHVVKPS
jgi:hypothetical protein